MERGKIHIEFNFHNDMLLQLFGELHNLPTKLAFYTYKKIKMDFVSFVKETMFEFQSHHPTANNKTNETHLVWFSYSHMHRYKYMCVSI